ncbi:phosphotyrosine protein phosphatases I [Tilletiaria anomala UBC 951]|uniref:Phosphotyrosine protein phosphatases I n=1 Tax=Tilletiaria anomala (strain ATCC 24038 / CBS 436.72 / UBC 951) TaxID=1037660 RepID=A0A066W1L6_TILAU|nr:phosphotyrosine protein phosphatases I [Tilletiaria anomala UBC 951]KDN44690.1 phosphotyrosine protein phosphatases I [Tilletiaria anomala UBC 951]
MAPVSVLFACTGNICRSPMAEAVFADLVKRNGLESSFGKIDSCGTIGYHVGEEADERTLAVCNRKGIPCVSRARRLKERDFEEFDYIFGMDSGHVNHLKARKPRNSKAKIMLFGDV